MTDPTRADYVLTEGSRMATNLGSVNYVEKATPAGYRCTGCGVGGRKLWREYNTFADRTQLLCAECALSDQKKPGPVDEKGYRVESDGHRTDQIGWLVPAVPTEQGDSYWGYTSVPQHGVDWWRRLPT